MKKIGVVADLHCGSEVGLTCFPKNKTQKELYGQWKKTSKWFGKLDALIVAGDMIHGSSKHQDVCYTEPDRLNQATIAATCLGEIDTKKYILCRGTASHVSTETGEDFENVIADHLAPKAEIYDYLESIECEGVIFRVKHKIGASSIPHGRATAALREVMWNSLNSVAEKEPKANVLLFAHVHYFVAVCNAWAEAIICPCWQARGGKYGNRECGGSVDNGALLFEINGDTYDWHRRLFVIQNKTAGRVKI